MHYEKLQIADTSFKHINHYRYLNNQIANRFMNNTYYSQWKPSQNILKNLQQEHRFRKSNTLTVNGTQLKTKQFPFNIVHLITFDAFHLALLPPCKKIAVSACKMKQFLLQQTVYKFFPGKKSFLSLNFTIFKLHSRSFGLPPKRVTSQSLKRFRFFIRPLCLPIFYFL